MDQHLQQHVEGQQVEVSDAILSELVDPAKLKKIYKLNASQKKGASIGKISQTSERKDMETFILGAMALKGS